MRRSIWTLLAGIAALAACAPVESQRGYVPDQDAIASLQVGTDTKDMVSKKLGDPSTAATFGGDTWYYISAHVEQNAFFAVEVQVERAPRNARPRDDVRDARAPVAFAGKDPGCSIE